MGFDLNNPAATMTLAQASAAGTAGPATPPVGGTPNTPQPPMPVAPHDDVQSVGTHPSAKDNFS